MEVMIQRKNVAIDATMFSSIQACGRYFDLRFNNNFVPLYGKSKALEMGSAVHVFLEFYHKSLIQGFSRDISISAGWAMLRTFLDGCPYCTDFVPNEAQPNPFCKHKPDEYPGAKLDDENVAIVKVTIEQYLEHYQNDSWVLLEAEVVKQKLIYSDDEVRILWKSKLDLMVDTPYGVKAVDHKTFAQRRDTTNLNNQFTGQCVVLGNNDMIINKIGFQKSVKPAEKFSRPVMSYSADRLHEWTNEIVPYWVKMYLSWAESGFWPADFKSCETKYGFCEFKEVCEADRGNRASELTRLYKVAKKWSISND